MIDLLSSYDYDFDESLIASYPANPKDSARLMVYDRATDSITHTTFRYVLDFIPSDTAIFLNDTKVIKARLYGYKSTGGKVEVLINAQLGQNRFNVYIKGKVKAGMSIDFENHLSAKIIKIFDDGLRIVEFFECGEICAFERLYEILEQIAHVPLPPYIKREDTTSDTTDYQTLFARYKGAVAAPTASLHFTPELFGEMTNKFDTHYLTLHVGAGTFKSVDTDNINDYQIHKESFVIPKSSASVINSHQKILAIGTTVTRTIEYFAKTNEHYGEADIFLHPMNLPKRVDYLITNFHLPRTTLLMLVASFLTSSMGKDDGLRKTLELYKIAVEKKYQFFSYGDAMMII